MVYRRARVLLGSDDEARDAMQEVFLRVLARSEDFRGEAPLLHWMYRITTNHCLDRLRKRRSHPVVRDPEAVERLLREDGDVDDRQAVLQVLGRMDEKTQRMAVYHYVDGMKMEEVAEVVGTSRKTVGLKLAAFRTKALRLLKGAR